MSSDEQEQVRRVARRIAEQIECERHGVALNRTQAASFDLNDISAMQKEFTKLNSRLAQLEAQISGDSAGSGDARRNAAMTGDSGTSAKTLKHAQQTNVPNLMGGGGTYVSAVHPSEQRFGINEAVTELVDYFEAGKTCEMEPGGKPCDHCGMCSARGF